MIENFKNDEIMEKGKCPSPVWLILTSIFAGLMISGPLAGMMLTANGKKRDGIILGAILGVVGFIILLTLFTLKIEWYWSSFIMLLVNIVSGITLYLIINPLWKSDITKDRIHVKLPVKLLGALGGLITALLITPVILLVYILLVDRFFSTYMPVAFSDEYAFSHLLANGIACLLVSPFVGLFIIRAYPKINLKGILIAALLYLWAFFTQAFWLETVIPLPAFQVSSATGQSLSGVMGIAYAIEYLFTSWWAAILLFYMLSPKSIAYRIKRMGYVFISNFSIAIMFALVLGYSSEAFLFLGKIYEKKARLEMSAECYERGMIKSPRKLTTSYLQYRTALLNHKLGNKENAKIGFERVVTKYNANSSLVKKASYFAKQLSKNSNGKRVVLAGVESKTEYRGSYCVPNSLALVMKYWGSNVNARTVGSKITGMSSGTSLIDETWYARELGFEHNFLPMAEIKDIKELIDAGFPVLVYVPAHIFVIFGYDEQLNTFVTYDVATRDVWVEYVQSDFVKAWKKQATTIVLAYPSEKEGDIPVAIRTRMDKLTDKYLHYFLHFYDTDNVQSPLAHLKKAYDKENGFFYPTATMYKNYPFLRDSLEKEKVVEETSKAIYDYFSNDFDEGIHLSGQEHYEMWASEDWALEYGISYLLANQKYELIKQLISTIDKKGQISDDMISIVAMIDIALGNFEEGLDRFNRAKDYDHKLYTGLASQERKLHTDMVRDLAKVISRENSARSEYSYSQNRAPDDYGYFRTAIANKTLEKETNFGESSEDILDVWEKWTSMAPFDLGVLKALVSLYEQSVTSLDTTTELYSEIIESKNIAAKRLEYYSKPNLYKK